MSASSAGFSLLEVMIATVIMSVGLLGVALLQSTSLRGTQTTNDRTQATMLVYDMLDRVRANRTNAVLYDSIRENSFVVDGRNGACAAAAPVPVQRSAADRIQWVCSVRRALPDALGRVTVTGAVPAAPGTTATPATVEVRLEWCDARSADVGGAPEAGFGPILNVACSGAINVILARSTL